MTPDTPTPAAPFLAPAQPRVAPPPPFGGPVRPAPSSPPGLHALHSLNDRHEERARQRRRGRRLGLVVVLLLLAGLGYGGWWLYESQQPKVVTFAPEERWVMDGESYSFAMPTTPVEDTVEETVMGYRITGYDWRIDKGDDLLLDVLAMHFASEIPEGQYSLAAGIDGVVEGMVERSDGTVTSDRTFTDGAVQRRTTVIKIDGGRLFVEVYGKGRVMLVVSGGVPFDDATPPDSYQGIVDSVVLK